MTDYAALIEAPDDLAVFKAFCDQLPADNPRKQLMDLQLAREVAHEPKEIEQLDFKIESFLKDNEHQLLGDLAPELLETDEVQGRTYDRHIREYRRGFLDSLSLGTLNNELAQKLVAFPEIELLRELRLYKVSNGRMPNFGIEVRDFWEGRVAPAIKTLGNARFESVRTFGYRGEVFPGGGIEEILACMPKLEKIRMSIHSIDVNAILAVELPHLGSLSLSGFLGDPLPTLSMNNSLKSLASLRLNPRTKSSEESMDATGIELLCQSECVRSLRHLSLECTDFGDEGLRLMAKYGVLQNLETLKLDFGAVTDRGIEYLIMHGNSLREVSLWYNYLTDEGADSLRAHFGKVETGEHHVGNPESSNAHLTHHRFDLYGH